MLQRLTLCLALLCGVRAQDAGVPVLLEGKEVFRVRASVGPLAAAARAQDIQRRLEGVAEASGKVVVTTQPLPADQGIVVMAGDKFLVLVTRQDTVAAGSSPQAVADQWADAIRRSLIEYRYAHSFTAYLLSASKALLAIAAFAGLFWLLLRALSLLSGRIHAWFERESASHRARGFSLLIWNRAALTVLLALKVFVAIFLLFQFSFLLSYIFGLFPQTAGISTTLLDYLKSVFGNMARAFFDYLPDAGVVVIVCLLTYYILQLLNLVAQAVEHGDLPIAGIHPEMARPTYQIARILIMLLTLVIVFPYLPGSQSDAFKGVSILVGVLITFGSGASIGNLLAGVVLTYMRPYKVGDRVKIADTVGDVLEKSLLVTRVRTIKNVEVVIPNSSVLNNQILNYSAMARNRGLILHTAVTIGYDAPWRDVHQALLNAAMVTEAILPDPKPFILQTSLNDYHVSYELNAFTDRPNEFEVTYSRLHQNIQDTFNKAGIEIMSPGYFALRDGNTVTIPAAHRPQDYNAPGFRIQP